MNVNAPGVLWGAPGVVAYWFAGPGADRGASARGRQPWIDRAGQRGGGRVIKGEKDWALASPEGARASPSNMSTFAQLRSLLGGQRGSVSTLAIGTILMGLSESALLILLAETAATLGTRAHHARIHIWVIHVRPSVSTLLLAALAVVFVAPAASGSAGAVAAANRIAHAGEGCARNCFTAFSRASWDVQARDREGQLQETMTGQVAQATSAMYSAMGLITSSSAAGGDVALGVRAQRSCGRVRGRPHRLAFRVVASTAPDWGAESACSLPGAAAICTRDSRVDPGGGGDAGVWCRRGSAQADGRLHQHRPWAPVRDASAPRLASNLYAAVISLLFVGGLFILYELGRGHAASLGAIVLILVRASSSGQNVQAAYQTLLQSMPFVERTQLAEGRYRESIPPVAAEPCRC